MNIIFNSSLIEINIDCQNDIQAIEKSGELLLKAQLCKTDYIMAMKEVYQSFGAYLVLDKGVAMPHARPEQGALETGFSIITLKNPIIFGHEDFDPVFVVIAIVSTASDLHLELIQLISMLLEHDLVSIATKAKTKQELFNFINPFITRNI